MQLFGLREIRRAATEGEARRAPLHLAGLRRWSPRSRMSSVFSTSCAHFNESLRVLPSLLAFFAATLTSLSLIVPCRSLRYSPEETIAPWVVRLFRLRFGTSVGFGIAGATNTSWNRLLAMAVSSESRPTRTQQGFHNVLSMVHQPPSLEGGMNRAIRAF